MRLQIASGANPDSGATRSQGGHLEQEYTVTSRADTIAAIMRVAHDYCFFRDTDQIDRIAETFTSDGVLDQRPTGFDVVSRGRAEIIEMFHEVARQTNGVSHYTTNHRIDIHDDANATGTAHFLAVANIIGGGELRYYGHYEDVYRVEDDQWRIASRAMVPHFPVESAGLAITGTTD